MSNVAGRNNGFVETDPIFMAHVASGIDSTDISNWNEAYTITQSLDQFYLQIDGANADQDIDIGAYNFSASTVVATTAIDTPEIYNTSGILKIQPNAQGDVSLFSDTDIDPSTDGKRLYLYRRSSAPDNDAYIKMLINQYMQFQVISSGTSGYEFRAIDGFMRFSTQAASTDPLPGDVIFNMGDNCELGIGTNLGSGNNPYLRQYGYITGVGKRNVYHRLLDTGYYTTQPNNASVLGWDIGLDIDLDDHDLETTGTITANIFSAGVNALQDGYIYLYQALNTNNGVIWYDDALKLSSDERIHFQSCNSEAKAFRLREDGTHYTDIWNDGTADSNLGLSFKVPVAFEGYQFYLPNNDGSSYLRVRDSDDVSVFSVNDNGDIDFSGLLTGGPDNIVNLSDNNLTTTGNVTANNLNISSWDSLYTNRIQSYGDGVQFSAGTLSADLNSTNLKITSSEINTIQDIDTTAYPQFAYMGIGIAPNASYDLLFGDLATIYGGTDLTIEAEDDLILEAGATDFIDVSSRPLLFHVTSTQPTEANMTRAGEVLIWDNGSGSIKLYYNNEGGSGLAALTFTVET